MDELEQVILLNLDEHSQSARTLRCSCGWRPDFKKMAEDRWKFNEYQQHREHLAEEIAKSVRWTR